MWTREDDIRGGFYRPMYVHRMKGAIDADGKITAWEQVIVGQSIMGKADLDETSVEGASDCPTRSTTSRVVSHNVELAVPPLWWRSVGHTHTGFAVETFVDELLAEGRQGSGRGPAGDARQRAAPRRRAEAGRRDGGLGLAGAGRPRARRRRGEELRHLCRRRSPKSRAGRRRSPRVHKVWCAVDCGVAVNPNVIKAQMEGGIGYGLGAVLFDEMTLGEGGKIMQSNFHDYRSLRINEMPDVEVAIIDSTEKPTGVGEPGVPPVGPAVANAWRRLTGDAGAPLADRAGRRVVMRLRTQTAAIVARGGVAVVAGTCATASLAAGPGAGAAPLKPATEFGSIADKAERSGRCSRRQARSSSIRAA